ncbi:hypothetical protein [Spirosoma aerolatum]|uniref:hypothetical protein n=1 Tax=Spirosoma aerolatum TaxID=1211326 RepID=UPI0009ABAE2B|nr:hypothetical protein [Spirosoma aerolatum]
MKQLVISLTLLLLTYVGLVQSPTINPDTDRSTAQIFSADLNNDPVFAKVVSNQIYYPSKPAARAVYGRYYVGFTVDNVGHIQQVSVLYPKMSVSVSRQYGFENSILAGLGRMPPLNPRLAGSYVLPVAFCFTHFGEGPNPIVPTNQLPQAYSLGSRILLSEVKVFAESPSNTRALNGFPPSRQIGQ